MTDTRKLVVGQKVRAKSKRWTPAGWEPVEEIATVVDPCVENDPDYAGDVEIKIEGILCRVFVAPDSVDVITGIDVFENERRFRTLIERIAAWTDAECDAVDARQTRLVAQVVIGGADPQYPPFAPVQS